MTDAPNSNFADLKEIAAEQPGVTSNDNQEGAPAPAAPAPEQQPVEKSGHSMTALDRVIHDKWGVAGLQDDIFKYVIQYADPETAKGTGKGFKLRLAHGETLQWVAPTQQTPEMITGPKRQFTQECADVIIMMAMARGWKSVNVQGNDQQKEMLWLAAQRAGVPVANFEPLADSAIRKQWEQEKLKHAEQPGVTESKFAGKAPEQSAAAPANPAPAAPVPA